MTSATFKVLNSSSCTTAFLLDSDTDYKSRFKPLVGKGVELDRCEFRIYPIGKESYGASKIFMHVFNLSRKDW